jgi:hypothetical protein
MIIAPFERLPAEILRREMRALDVRPHRPIKDQNFRFERFEI